MSEISVSAMEKNNGQGRLELSIQFSHKALWEGRLLDIRHETCRQKLRQLPPVTLVMTYPPVPGLVERTSDSEGVGFHESPPTYKSSAFTQSQI